MNPAAPAQVIAARLDADPSIDPSDFTIFWRRGRGLSGTYVLHRRDCGKLLTSGNRPDVHELAQHLQSWAAYGTTKVCSCAKSRLSPLTAPDEAATA